MASPQIHPSAVVDASATLAEDVTVGPYAIIEADVEIARGVKVWPHAHVCRYTKLGENCQVHMGAVVGHLPQDLAYEECESSCRVGAGTIIREYATIHRGTKAGTETVLGERCYIMGVAHVAHNCVLGNDVILGHGAGMGGYVEVGERTFIGGTSVIHQFCRIGRLAMLSGYLALSMDVPPFHRAAGVNSLNGLNVVGIKRAGLSREARRAIKEAHRIIFRSGLPLEEALARVEAELPQDEAREMARFCRESTRGICRLRAPKGAVDAGGDVMSDEW